MPIRYCYAVTSGGGPNFHVHVKGRDFWALERRRAAGMQSCSPIAQPAPRWAAYIPKRRQLGIEVEKLHENHGLPFPVTHARFVLRSRVDPVKPPEEVRA